MRSRQDLVGCLLASGLAACTTGAVHGGPSNEASDTPGCTAKDCSTVLAEHVVQCGVFPDGCGSQLTCNAACTGSDTCGGAGVANTCGTNPAPVNAFFPAGSIWSTDISTAPLDPDSAATIAWMHNNGNWGAGQLSWWPYDFLRISTEWHVLYADDSAPLVPFHQSSDYILPDCDADLTQFPLPPGGAIEGVTGYSPCETDTGGDCHMVVFNRSQHKLYESYQTNYVANAITSGCGIVWDTSKAYPPDGRGDQCTSTDAAGLPPGALIFSADDLAAGHIDHALRLTLPNSRIRQWVFVHPATHSTGNVYGQSGVSGGASAPSPAPIYGARLRLRSDFDVTSYPAAMQVILVALQKYGMIVSDGGDMCVTAANDADTVHKYSELGVNVDTGLSFLAVTDFEVVDGGARIPLTYTCVRNGL